MVLEGVVEVDHDVPAHDEVELVERAVGRQVVLREYDVLLQRAVEPGALVGGDVVLGELLRAARGEVVLGVLLHLLEREEALLCLLDDRLVDVRRVDAAALVEAFLS